MAVTREEMSKLPKIVAVDFDGTLVSENFPEIGEPDMYMFRLFKELKKKGIKLILWTSRNGQQLADAVSFCAKQGLYFDAVNENIPEVIELFGGDTRKVHADLYIDDKAVPVTQSRYYWLPRIGLNPQEILYNAGIVGD